jgi:Ca-activated chloride channel family protein
MDGWVFLRPWWLLAYLPVMGVFIYWWFRPQIQTDWHKLCDPKLLHHFKYNQGHQKWISTWLSLLLSLVLMVFALSGPAWKRLPIPVGELQKPVVIVLDLSSHMYLDDITPNRLQRAKFLIEDSLKAHQDIQWGLIVFTKMPFIVSPMTNDVQNILNFLPALQPKILPVGGYDIAKALGKAKELVQQAGFLEAKIMVIASQKPQTIMIKNMQKLADEGLDIAWIEDSSLARPIQIKQLNYMTIRNATEELPKWLDKGFNFQVKTLKTVAPVMQWRDEGRWFLCFAMIPLVGVFRKGWFIRLWV